MLASKKNKVALNGRREPYIATGYAISLPGIATKWMEKE